MWESRRKICAKFKVVVQKVKQPSKVFVFWSRIAIFFSFFYMAAVRIALLALLAQLAGSSGNGQQPAVVRLLPCSGQQLLPAEPLSARQPLLYVGAVQALSQTADRPAAAAAAGRRLLQWQQTGVLACRVPLVRLLYPGCSGGVGCALAAGRIVCVSSCPSGVIREMAG